MGFRIVYKGKDSKTCSYTEATRLIADGWSWTKDVTVKLTPAKKTAKLKKAKVKVEAVVEKPTVMDFGSINEEN